MKDWNLLIDSEIIGLIIGDNEVKVDIIHDLKMPYMTGKDICEFSTKLGLKQDYEEERLSRKDYMTKTLEYVIKNDKISIFFKELFELKRFRKVKLSVSIYSTEQVYWDIMHNFFVAVNRILFFDKCHIEYNLKTFEFCLVDDEKEITLKTEKIKHVDRQYIKDLKEQIDKVLKNGDYESAITKSRTMIEEVMVLGIERKGEIATEKGNINNLYNQFKGLYKMHQNKEIDKRINHLLSGIDKIITAISQMRDKNSDSHGVGDKRINIEEHHTVLFINSAITMSNFLLAVIEKNSK